MPSRGQVTLSTELGAIDEDYRALHPEVASGSYAMIAVSDDGMTSDIIERAFQAVLHYQGGRQGFWPRAEHGVRLRQAIRRPCLDLQRVGPRDNGPDLFAAR